MDDSTKGKDHVRVKKRVEQGLFSESERFEPPTSASVGHGLLTALFLLRMSPSAQQRQDDAVVESLICSTMSVGKYWCLMCSGSWRHVRHGGGELSVPNLFSFTLESL